MRTIFKQLYSSLVRISSRFSRKTTPKNRLAYLLSFPANDLGLLARLKDELPKTEIQIFYTKNCEEEAKTYESAGFKIKSLNSPLQLFLVVIPWIMTAQVIICDNYFAFLGDLALSESQKVFQIWHANGAIKTFGWLDEKTARRSKSDQARFQKVYNQFDQILVGSEAMATVFKESYHLSDTHILRTGLPRTDYFWDEPAKQAATEKIEERFPDLIVKKTVLYVPTYRDQGDVDYLKLAELSRLLGEEYLVVCKAHPHTVATSHGDAIVNTDFKDIALNELLITVDYLVTDYSSIPFEYGLANPQGKIIFYCPDLTTYQQTTGIRPSFATLFEKEAVKTTAEVASKILTNQLVPVTTINETWNEYNDGQASTRLLEVLHSHLG